MSQVPPEHVTQLLVEANEGDRSAKERLFKLVEQELRLIAEKQLRGERSGHSLQATMLVDDTLLQLVGSGGNVSWENRKHFYRTASRTMRRILIDHERRRRAQRRGGGKHRQIDLDPNDIGKDEIRWDLLALDEALNKLAMIDARQSEVVELHHFGGCSLSETADILDVSASTVKNEWRMAKAWLHRELVKD